MGAPHSKGRYCSVHKLIWVLPLSAAAVLAGEAPAPAPAPAPAGGPAAAPAPAEAKPVVREIEFNPLDNDGRRDPFTYVKYVPQKVDVATQDPGEAERQARQKALKEIEGKKLLIVAAKKQAEQSLMQAKGVETVAHCDEAMKIFKDIDITQVPELQLELVRDDVLRLRKAGDQLKNRQDAEAAFKTLGIQVTGVVAREHGSQAIVNSKIVSKGEVVTTSSDNADVIVEDILPRQVVFLFKNYKILLKVSELQNP